MSRFSTAIRYAAYRLQGKTKHGIHSPFVYHLLTEVIKDAAFYPAYDKVEKVRKRLLADEREIRMTDLGAGSKTTASPVRKIKNICRHAEKNKKYGQLLFRLARHFKPEVIFELGTSLGVTTLYLSEAAPAAKVITIEGCPEIMAVAKENFRAAGASNIHCVNANFDDVFKSLLTEHGPPPTARCQLFFFDGNHRKAPTLRYFEQCMAHAHNDSVFIFDDIYWSREMEEAWEAIKKDERVRVTIDLFQMGLVFTRKEQAKENFVLKF